MPDVFGVYDDMKVWEYLDFFARCYGIPADRRRRMIGDLLDLVDLGAKRDTYVQGLSRGMQQRLCLAHTLVHDPQVLLLDEPASGLDPRARVELRELLRELRTLGKTILVSSATSFPSSRSCARRWRSSTAARSSPTAGSPTSSGGCGSGRCSASASSATRTAVVAARRGSSASQRRDGPDARGRRRSRSGSTATTRAPPALLAAAVGAGLRVATFSRAASDLEELFLQVTAQDPVGDRRPSRRRMSAVATRPPDAAASARCATSGTGIAAVGVKELRGRMRGRRAFIVLTIHLVFVAGFAWMIETLSERSFTSGFGGSMSASAEIGRTMFSALIMLLTLIVLVLAPASTAGAISLEREKQTLDLLTTTPISSLAIILGKLLSRPRRGCSCCCSRRSR